MCVFDEVLNITLEGCIDSGVALLSLRGLS